MTKSRRRFGTDQKAAILKRYLVDKVPISDLCDEYGIKHTMRDMKDVLIRRQPAAHDNVNGLEVVRR